jgi:hypothetical protein
MGPSLQGRRLVVAGLAAGFLMTPPAIPAVAQSPVPEESLTLEQLIDLPEKDLAKVDIATMNLAAAAGLPGSETIDREKIRKTIDAWALRVAAVTASKTHFFRSNPDYYENSWAKFCSIMLVLTLQQDLGVHYNLAQRTNPTLAKSEDQFIHGVVQGTGGTCASLPVVFVAVGRRLGYPLRLAQSFSHFYARWDDPVTAERFNIEGSNPGGLDFQGEDHYRERAREMGAGSLEAGNYLQSMSPREELSAFLTTRGDCLRENGLLVEAHHTYQKAVETAPRNLFAAGLLRLTTRELQARTSLVDPEVLYQRLEQQRQQDPRFIVPGIPTPPAANPVSIRRIEQAGFPAPAPAVPGLRPSPGFGNLDGTGWRPPSFTDWLEDTNRRNRELMQFMRATLHPRQGDVPAVPAEVGAPAPFVGPPADHGARP